MVIASFIHRLSHAIDQIEKRSQPARPFKVVTARRGYHEDSGCGARSPLCSPSRRSRRECHDLRVFPDDGKADEGSGREPTIASTSTAIAAPAKSSLRRTRTRGPTQPLSHRQCNARRSACVDCDRVQPVGRTSCPFVWRAGSLLHIVCGSVALELGNAAHDRHHQSADVGLVSHQLSPIETKPQPISSSSCRIFCRSRLDRARRSNLTTVTTSPCLRAFISLANSGLPLVDLPRLSR